MRRRGISLVIWLALLATLGSAFFPLLHDHAHDHRAPWHQAGPADERETAASQDLRTAEAPATAPSDADTAPDACAVCAHYASTCLSILCQDRPVAAAAQVPLPQAVVPWQRPQPVAWLLPASRAPPQRLSFSSPSIATA